MPNTTPDVVAFMNQRVRSRCELFRAVYALLLDDKLRWETISGNVPADTDIIDDGRAAEGIEQFTNADLIAFTQIESAMLTAFENPAILSLISKGCVRALELTLPIPVGT